MFELSLGAQTSPHSPKTCECDSSSIVSTHDANRAVFDYFMPYKIICNLRHVHGPTIVSIKLVQYLLAKILIYVRKAEDS